MIDFEIIPVLVIITELSCSTEAQIFRVLSWEKKTKT